MIPIIKYQGAGQQELLKRPVLNYEKTRLSVSNMMQSVKTGGDKAVRAYTRQFDQVILRSFEVSEAEWQMAADKVSSKLRKSIDTAFRNIYAFHEAQKEKPLKLETMPGVLCSRRSVPIEKVGLYVPGGTAPLFSTLLMLGIPALIAGCREIVVCTPPDSKGSIHPGMLYAARKIGISRIFKVGGVQAIAAMTYGTESIPRVYKIFGPGNQYVTQAKMMAQSEGLAIDMPAGPSELAILADESCVPEFVAADLLSQAEHGADSQVVLVSDNAAVLKQVQFCLKAQLKLLPRKDIALQALFNSKAVWVSSLSEGMQLINDYAPEHLIIACDRDEYWADKVINAGSVFLGNYSPESAGDYASGTNHTLPTNGYARAFSGVSLDSFMKKITYQKLSKEGLGLLGSTVMQMAAAEGLFAHANAVAVRLKKESSYEEIINETGNDRTTIKN
jgi:histidinol dehydrogenase